MTTAMAAAANFEAMFWLISVTPFVNNALNRDRANRVPTIDLLQGIDLSKCALNGRDVRCPRTLFADRADGQSARFLGVDDPGDIRLDAI
jgi:hypothetical protein